MNNTHKISEGEVTEEMIAKRLRDELNLFKSGTRPRDRELGKKSSQKNLHPKNTKPTEKRG